MSVNTKTLGKGSLCCVGRCLIRGANNLNISTHAFPDDPSLKRQWVHFVQTTRADFFEKNVTKATRICGLHFNADDLTTPLMSLPGFNPSPSGRKVKKVVHVGAVPCIKYHKHSRPVKQPLQKRPSSKMVPLSPQQPKRARTSYQNVIKKQKVAVSLYILITIFILDTMSALSLVDVKKCWLCLTDFELKKYVFGLC